MHAISMACLIVSVFIVHKEYPCRLPFTGFLPAQPSRNTYPYVGSQVLKGMGQGHPKMTLGLPVLITTSAPLLTHSNAFGP